jgi:hypothetical protein
MKLPRFPRKDIPQQISKEDEQVFAEASELAVLRLEQCMADLQTAAMRQALSASDSRSRDRLQ